MRLSDQQKGIFFALGGILIITPDSFIEFGTNANSLLAIYIPL